MVSSLNTARKRYSSESSSALAKLRSELAQEKWHRQAAEKECEKLRADVARLEERVEQLLQSQQKMENFLQQQIRKLEKDVADRDEKLVFANKQLAWFRKTYFIGTSEKHVPEPEEEPSTDEKDGPAKPSGAKQKNQKKDHRRADLSDLPSQDQELVIDDCNCKSCGKRYRKLDGFENSPLVEYIFALTLTNYQRAKYVPDCKCEGGQILTAAPPAKLYNRTRLGNSVWLHLVVQKFLYGIPTNRTLKQFQVKGLPLAAGTVTGGFKRINELLEPLYTGIAEHCRGGEYWNADETTWRVFGTEREKWWLWIIASQDAIMYTLDPSRSSKVPSYFFAGSAGTLMTDRYGAYKGLHDGILKSWCWVHVRRDFLRVYEGIPKLRRWARKWLNLIAELFVLAEERFRAFKSGYGFGKDWDLAQNKLQVHLQRMKEDCDLEVSEINQNKERQKVLASLKRHWPGLTLFVSDPRIPLHNNRAERLLRNAVILRKSSFGSGSQWAGELAARLFSILQTWLANGLDPEAMLEDFFAECSKPGRPPPDISRFLPWMMSSERKLHFALPKTYSKPG
jgi:transposase